MRRTALLLIPSLLLAAVGCTEHTDQSGTSSAPVAPTAPPPPSVEIEQAPSVTVAPAPAGPTVIELDGVTVTLPVGSLDAAATVRASSAQTTGAVPGFTVAGPGVHLDIAGGALAMPAEVQFDVGPPPSPDHLPATLHVTQAGEWDLVPASANDRGIQLTTSDFSAHIPGWLDPLAAAKQLVGGAVNLVGLRTSPPDCRPTAPWAAITQEPYGVVHTCMSSNPDGHPELVIKSNRSYWMQVTVPQPNQWVWVSNMPGIAHQVVFGPDTNRYLLPPGETMTVGLSQPAASLDMTVAVERNSLTYAISFLSLITGEMENWVADVYALVQCGLASITTDGDAAGAARAAFGCVSSLFGGFEDSDTAIAAAREVMGEQALTDPKLTEAFDRLVKRFKGFGQFLTAIGVAVTLLGSVDMLSDDIATNAAESVVRLRLEAPAAPTPPPTAPAPQPTAAPPPPAPATLGVVFTEQPFRCDGTLHSFGRITGAIPGEYITFYSPQVPGLVNGYANNSGELSMRWACEPYEAGQSWSLTATGASSGRTITIVIQGA